MQSLYSFALKYLYLENYKNLYAKVFSHLSSQASSSQIISQAGGATCPTFFPGIALSTLG